MEPKNYSTRILRRLVKISSFILLLFITLSQNSIAQCNLKKDVDEFSKRVVIEGSMVKLISVFPLAYGLDPWDLSMQFRLVNDTLRLTLKHASQSVASAVSSMIFKFKDDSVFTIANKLYSSEAEGGAYRYEFSIFSLPKELLIKFSSTNLSKYRVIFEYFPQNGVYDKEASKDVSNTIKKDAICLLKELK